MQDRIQRVVTADRLREVLSYEPETGEWRWRISTGARGKIGALAGCLSGGYRIISIDGIAYRSGRLAFLYMNGEWPKHEAEHKNRLRGDDRWENLEDRTSLEQKHNRGRYSRNTSGFGNVDFHKPTNRWRVRVTFDGQTKTAYRKTREEAVAARDLIRVHMGVPEAVDEPDTWEDGSVPATHLYCMITDNKLLVCECCRRPCEYEDGEPIEDLVADVNPETKEANLVCRPCKRVIDFEKRFPEIVGSLGAVELYLVRRTKRAAA